MNPPVNLPNFDDSITEYMAQALIDNRCVIESKTSTDYAKIEASIKLVELARMNHNRHMNKSVLN